MRHWKWKVVLVALALGVLLVEMVTAKTVRLPEGSYHAVASDTDTSPTGFNFEELDLYTGWIEQNTGFVEQTAFEQPAPQEVPPLPIDPDSMEIVTDDESVAHEGHYDDGSFASDRACGCRGSEVCGYSCRGRHRCLACCEEEPYRLFPCGILGFDVGGWVEGGYTANGDNPPSNFSGPLTFNDRIDGQENQVYAYIERPTCADGCGISIGGRVDLLYGTDHRFTMARGLETRGDLSNRWNNQRFFGLAMPQAYMEVAINNTTIKLGHFYTIVGFESVPARNNFFYSRAYTMQYGEPFTHTGVLASYAACDRITLHGGFDRGWDNWEDDNDQLSGLFGATWDNGCGTSLAFAGTAGKEISPISNINDDRYMYSVVLSHEVNDRLSFVVQHDYGIQNNAISGSQDAEWYGVNSYLFYKLNCCWTAGTRLEWFRDDDGARVQGLGDANPIRGAQFAGNFYGATFGLNYTGIANLLVRPEVRYDWYHGNDNAGMGGRRPFDDGNSSKQFTAAIDVIMSY